MNRILSSPIFWCATLITIAIVGYLLYNQAMIPISFGNSTKLDMSSGDSTANNLSVASGAPSTLNSGIGRAPMV